MVGEAEPISHVRYTRLHADGMRLWVETIAIIRLDTLKDGRIANFPEDCAVVGDIDADGLPDVDAPRKLTPLHRSKVTV